MLIHKFDEEKYRQVESKNKSNKSGLFALAGLILVVFSGALIYWNSADNLRTLQNATVKTSISDAVSSNVPPDSNNVTLPPSPNPEVKTNPEISTLIFAGDIMLSRGIGTQMVKHSDWTYPFLKIADFTKDADLTFANLEGPISSRGTKVGSIYSFRANPLSVQGLLYAGIDIVSVANNHIWDYSTNAFDDTLTILAENNIASVGGGHSFDEVHTAVIKEVNGTKIAFLAYTNLLPSFLGSKNATHAVAYPDSKQVAIDVSKAKTESDLVVVSFHWGEEYKKIHNAYQEKLAHVVIDAGGDLVIGHHPHVSQDIEEYNGKYIVYSLGNFVFDQNFSKDTRNGSIVKVTLEGGKVSSLDEYKIKFTDTFQAYLEEEN